jgi:hypothetical protein
MRGYAAVLDFAPCCPSHYTHRCHSEVNRYHRPVAAPLRLSIIVAQGKLPGGGVFATNTEAAVEPEKKDDGTLKGW